MSEFQNEPNTAIPQEEVSVQAAAAPVSNIPLGTLGAFLGAALGAVVWIALYQFGYIAAVCGLLMVFLAMKGYEKLGKTMDKTGLIISVAIALVMIYAAVYLSWAVGIYIELKDMGASPTVQNTLDMTRLILADAESKSAFNKDLLTGYGLSILGAAGMIIRSFKGTK